MIRCHPVGGVGSFWIAQTLPRSMSQVMTTFNR